MRNTFKVLICGDRNWSDRKKIEDYIRTLPKGTVIIEGEAEGADRIAREVGERLGYEVKKVRADWSRHGRAAGPIRNKRMLEEKPDLVVAFHGDISKSKGTKDMVSQADKAGIKVVLNP